MKTTKSTFIKVKCTKCKNEQHVFSHNSTAVYCLVCNELLAATTGGKAILHGSALEHYT